jgi:hypothetical protein
MDEESYIQLLQLVTPYIKRNDTNLRMAISPPKRLSATLRYLATGRKYADLKFTTATSASSLCKIVPETCKAIIKVLKDYMKVSSLYSIF